MGCCGSSEESAAQPYQQKGGGGGGQARAGPAGALKRAAGADAAFLQRHAPNGDIWANYLSPVPPVVTDGRLGGAWADCVYAACVFELTNPQWEQMPEFADGPVEYILRFARELNNSTFCGDIEAAEERYKNELQQPMEAGSQAFLRHKARNGKTWMEYLRASDCSVEDKSGFVNGAWGEAVTAAVIFEHENPSWDQLGPYSADGPAGQVLEFLNECGKGNMMDPLANTETQTHSAVQNGGKLPVFDASFYQPPVKLMPAPVVNQAPPRPSGRKKGLLIGCNYPGSSAQLNGCCNDVDRWTQYLLRGCGFAQNDIVQLKDEGCQDFRFFPSRANFIAGIRWLVEGAQPGDVLFFQFSGHGGQRESKDMAEADGMDEVLIPTDYEEAGTIVDHELFDLMVVPLPSGVKLTVILDCCHSGSALDLPFVWEEQRGQWDTEPYPWHTAGDVQMFSGCEDRQCSMDASRNGWPAGAMTTAALDVLEGGFQGGYPDFLYAMLNVLTQRNFDQKPKLSSSQAFDPGKPFSLLDHIVPNLNVQLGQARLPPPKPSRANVGGFAW